MLYLNCHFRTGQTEDPQLICAFGPKMSRTGPSTHTHTTQDTYFNMDTNLASLFETHQTLAPPSLALLIFWWRSNVIYVVYSYGVREMGEPPCFAMLASHVMWCEALTEISTPFTIHHFVRDTKEFLCCVTCGETPSLEGISPRQKVHRLDSCQHSSLWNALYSDCWSNKYKKNVWQSFFW